MQKSYLVQHKLDFVEFKEYFWGLNLDDFPNWPHLSEISGYFFNKDLHMW